LLPRDARVLDVGTGDGQIAANVLEIRPDLDVAGVDVLVREKTHIAVREFDGYELPFGDDTFDCVVFVDVLHHTEDPAVLLKEARRVSRQFIVLKDHTRDGLLANATLRFMDRVGNLRHGVVLPYNYLSRTEWDAVFDRVGLEVVRWENRLSLYPFWARPIFERSLHFFGVLASGSTTHSE
jgi:ubiquinone/menaquinone biosynthesis C-methylase UbiE